MQRTELEIRLRGDWRDIYSSKMELEGIDHVAISVRDVEASARWYCEVLGLERAHDEVIDCFSRSGTR